MNANLVGIEGLSSALSTAGVAVAYAPPRRDQKAWRILALALTLTVFEGAIRKWLIGSTFQLWSYLAYFSKDLVFALLLLLPGKINPSPGVEVFRRWLAPGCFLLICGAIGSGTETVVFEGAVLTLRSALVLPLLAFFAAARERGISLTSVAWLLGIYTVANFLLGASQNQLPPGHLLNRYAADVPNIVATETGVRATGSFSYITGMGVFSVVGVWAGLVYLSSARSMRQQIFACVVLASGIGCGLASISRGPLLIEAVMVIIWLLASGNLMGKKTRALAAVALCVAVALVMGVTGTFSDLSQGLLQRIEASEDTVHDRAFAQLDEAVMAFEMAPFGNGLGTEQVGRFALSSGVLTHTSYESQLPRIILEVGLPGFLGFLAISIGAIVALQAVKSYHAPPGRKAALLATQLLLAATIYNNVVFNHIASAFVWMIFAAVLASKPEE